MIIAPIPKGMALYYKNLRSFFEWYKLQVEKDPSYGSKRSNRVKKKKARN